MKRRAKDRCGEGKRATEKIHLDGTYIPRNDAVKPRTPSIADGLLDIVKLPVMSLHGTSASSACARCYCAITLAIHTPA